MDGGEWWCGGCSVGLHRIYSRRMLQLQPPPVYVHGGSGEAHQSSLIIVMRIISIIIIITAVISNVVVITRARFQ